MPMPASRPMVFYGRAHSAGSAQRLTEINVQGSGGHTSACRFICSFIFVPALDRYQRNLEALAGLNGGDAADLINEALERAGLTGAGRKRVRGYSLGMRQRLGPAAVMLRRLRLLILDEPTNGMDPAGIRDLRVTLRRLAGYGLAVILSSHNLAQIEDICDSVTVLHHGRACSRAAWTPCAPMPLTRSGDCGPATARPPWNSPGTWPEPFAHVFAFRAVLPL